MTAVFRKAFRDSRRTMIWLSIGLSVYLFTVLGFYPALLDQQEQLDELMQSFPKEIISVFTGGLDLETVSFADPGVYLHGRFASWLILILGVVTIVQAFNAITNAERDNTIDVMLSFPVTRREMLLARFANTVVTVLIVLTVVSVAMIMSTQLIPEFDLDIGKILLVTYGTFFVVIVPGAVAYMLASLVPSSKRWPGAAVYALFIGSYLLVGFASSVDFIDRIRGLLIFDYYNASELINHGVKITDWVLPSVAVILFVAIAWWAIDRKQLGV